MKRVVLITGTSGGIGRATAEVFAMEGWRVVGVDKHQPDDTGSVARFIRADIAKPEVPEQILAELSSQEGRLDALVNNAAVQICKPLLQTTMEEWDLTIASNVRAPFLFVRASYALLKKSGGAVVNVSSVHALATSLGLAAYAASKGALVALTRAMAMELGGEGIRVNAILPGAVDTEMLRAGLIRSDMQGDKVDDLIKALGMRHVLGRVGRPEEIGRSILFLADNEQSSFMTGQAVVVDGGATARLSTE